MTHTVDMVVEYPPVVARVREQCQESRVQPLMHERALRQLRPFLLLIE